MTTPFSVRLSAILKSRGMSQTDLAAVSGLTPSAVNRYVNGNRVPSIEVTERICAALGVGPEVFADSFSAFSAKQLADFCRENARFETHSPFSAQAASYNRVGVIPLATQPELTSLAHARFLLFSELSCLLHRVIASYQAH